MKIITKANPAWKHFNAFLVYHRTVRESVEIPEKVPLAMATKGEFLKYLRGIAECSLKVKSSTSVSPLSLCVCSVAIVAIMIG